MSYEFIRVLYPGPMDFWGTFFAKIQNHAMHSAGYDSDGGE